MARRWVLVADASTARVMGYNESIKEAWQLQAFTNEDARLHEGDLTTDRAGRQKNQVLEGPSAKAHSVETFAKDLATMLASARVRGDYEEVALVAPAQFLGILKAKLDAATTKVVSHTCAKDVVHEPTPTLVAHLEKLVPAPTP